MLLPHTPVSRTDTYCVSASLGRSTRSGRGRAGGSSSGRFFRIPSSLTGVDVLDGGVHPRQTGRDVLDVHENVVTPSATSSDVGGAAPPPPTRVPQQDVEMSTAGGGGGTTIPGAAPTNAPSSAPPPSEDPTMRPVCAPCNHWFHRRCLEEWMNVKMECPTCRATLPPLET